MNKYDSKYSERNNKMDLDNIEDEIHACKIYDEDDMSFVEKTRILQDIRDSIIRMLDTGVYR